MTQEEKDIICDFIDRTIEHGVNKEKYRSGLLLPHGDRQLDVLVTITLDKDKEC